MILAAGSAGQNPAPSQPALQSSTKSAANPQTQKAAPKPAPLEVPQLKFEKYKLQNGLLVILSEDHRLPMVAVNLWYHVGPANELPGRTPSRWNAILVSLVNSGDDRRRTDVAVRAVKRARRLQAATSR